MAGGVAEAAGEQTLPSSVVARPKVETSLYRRRYLALEDFESAARRRLPKLLYGYVAGAAETGFSLRDNRAAFDEWGFVPRILANVSGREQETTLFGRTYAAPFGIAPMGAAALCAYRADLALARAASAMNVPMVLSAASLIKLEEVRRAGATSWFQAYMPGDLLRIAPLVDRVAAAGYDTFVVTGDVPVPANRENNVRNHYQIPMAVTPKVVRDSLTHPGWLLGILARTLLRHGMPYLENMDADRGPPIFSKSVMRNITQRDELAWEHVEFIRRRWKGNLVVKGVLSAEDARIARESGVDGVIVSNHGGRQLDGAIAPLRVLPEIVAASGSMAVMLDGGIRRGTDVLKALALGAKFVFVGRPFLFAAVIGGEQGVRHALDLLFEEIDRDMALLGMRSIAEMRPDLIRRLTQT